MMNYIESGLLRTEDTVLMSPTWRRDRHFTWSSEPQEGLAVCEPKESNPRPPALQSSALLTEPIPQLINMINTVL